MAALRIIGCLVMVSSTLGCLAQSSLISLGMWHLRNISGEVDLRGHYRQLESSFNEITEDQRSTYLLGGIKLNTSSYLWDPDVVLIDLAGEFSPETRDENYITVPDRSEVRTLKKVDLMTTLCNNRPVTLQGFLNYDQNYFNRELLTNVRSNNLQWGGRLSLNNKILPLTISYRNVNWDQEETETGRIFRMDQDNLQARATKSFGSRDRSELVYSHNDYLYSYAGLHQTLQQIDRLALHNNIYLDSARNYNLNSRIIWYNQEGTTAFRRFEVLEGITLNLPYNLRGMLNFDLYNLKDPRQVWDQKRGRASLQHKLFESLTSKIYFDYARVDLETSIPHRESDIRSGIDLKYTKKIPTGTLNLTYRYYRHGHTTEGETGFIQVFNEEQRISDGEVTLLNKPYIETPSVVVKDISGGIIYQPNFDYIIIQRASYLEIQRVPGGQIPNGGTVYVDYAYQQPGNYSYGASNNHFTASVLLFKRLIELYYSYGVQDYPRVDQGDLLTLNYFTQHLYGVRMDVGFARGGIEADRYESSIIPYRMRRYYLDVNWNIRSKLILNLNGNIRDYRMIADEEDQLYSNISGRVAYRINPRMRLSLESGYLNQRGTNIDLDLLTARAMFHASFNKLHLRTGVEMYRRLYQNSEFALNGAFLQLTRKF